MACCEVFGCQVSVFSFCRAAAQALFVVPPSGGGSIKDLAIPAKAGTTDGVYHFHRQSRLAITNND
jgi:hypothetical protein